VAVAGVVTGRAAISPALRSQTTPDETVFIFARAVNGPRMPLAIQRVRVADLPLDFHLDDTQAMSPENKISTAKALRIEVRVSKSGQAMPAPGDLTGSSAPVAPGAQGVQVLVDQVIK
jgi:cytochrome c-type biogenesis protein CcmH